MPLRSRSVITCEIYTHVADAAPKSPVVEGILGDAFSIHVTIPAYQAAAVMASA